MNKEEPAILYCDWDLGIDNFIPVTIQNGRFLFFGKLANSSENPPLL